jgi:Tfp pilus assembly protein PilF
MKKYRFGALCLVMVVVLSLPGCAGKPVSRCTAPGDTPERHLFSGMAALDKRDLATARAELERAVYCDAGYPPAYDGLAIARAFDAAQSNGTGSEKTEKEKALVLMREAGRRARTAEDAFGHYLAAIRVYTIMESPGWVAKAEDAYERANRLTVNEQRLIYYEGVESLQYFMGIAYLRACEFQKARDMFARVLDARTHGKWQAPADRAWKKTDKVSRALAGEPEGYAGRKVAVQGFVTRAELSALLVEGLRIDPPGLTTGVTPLDIAGNPFETDVLTVLKWKTRGLELKYDAPSKAYLFAPNDRVRRGEMAFILEDLLLKKTGDEGLARRYVGQEKSPFSDIAPTSPFYNAVMTVTSRGLMEGDPSGHFRADSPLDGADAILAIRTLRQVTGGP